MILPKQEIVKRALVTETIDESQFQPAGVDLTMQQAFSFKGAGQIDFDNKERKLPDCEPLLFAGEWVKLEPGCYKIRFNEYVKIPEDCVALAWTRSSLLRSGAFMQNAVWDPGYHGRSEALLVVQNPHGLKLKKNAKLLQLVFVKLAEKASSLYAGQYLGENKQ